MNKRCWIEVRISYDDVAENGETTRMANTWLVRAATFAEAESRAVEAVSKNGGDVVDATACTKRKFAAVWVNSPTEEIDTAKFYKIRCEIIRTSENTGKERRSKCDYLMLSSDMLEAYNAFLKFMSDETCGEIEVLSINLTPIVEVLSEHE